MREAFFDSVAIVRIEAQHFAQKVETHWVGSGEQVLPRLLASFGKRFYEIQSLFVADVIDVVVIRRAQNTDDSLDLVEVIFAWK